MIYRFENCEVEVSLDAEYVVTRFSDGATVEGVPIFDQESITRAGDLGYVGSAQEMVREMTRWHDLLHTVIAEARGEPWSPTLHAVAHGYRLAPGVVEQEERMVLFVQRLMASGIVAILEGHDVSQTRSEAP